MVGRQLQSNSIKNAQKPTLTPIRLFLLLQCDFLTVFLSNYAFQYMLSRQNREKQQLILLTIMTQLQKQQIKRFLRRRIT